MLNRGLMDFLVKVLVDKSEDGHDCFESGCALVGSQNLVFAQTSIHWLKQRIEDALIEEICASAKRAKFGV